MINLNKLARLKSGQIFFAFRGRIYTNMVKRAGRLSFLGLGIKYPFFWWRLLRFPLSFVEAQVLIEAVEFIPKQCYAEPAVQGFPKSDSGECVIDQPVISARVETTGEATASEQDFRSASAETAAAISHKRRIGRKARLDRRLFFRDIRTCQMAGWPRQLAVEESPGSAETRRRVTPGRCEPRESATENKPPRFLSGVRVKRCGKSAPRWQ